MSIQESLYGIITREDSLRVKRLVDGLVYYADPWIDHPKMRDIERIDSTEQNLIEGVDAIMQLPLRERRIAFNREAVLALEPRTKHAANRIGTEIAYAERRELRKP